MIAEWALALNQRTGINLSVLYDRFDAAIYLKGLVVAIELAAGCVVFSVLIGVLAGALSTLPSKILRGVVGSYVNVFRNTPPLIQLYFFYFGVSAVLPRVQLASGETKHLLDSFQWCLISLSLFGGAYNAEVFRAGIQAVPQPTWRAAEALAYSRFKAFIYIILPLAFRISLPALNNNLVTLVKGTTVGYAIGVPELISASTVIWSSSSNIPEMMVVLMITYLIIVSAFVALMNHIEKRLKYPGMGV